MFWHQFFISSFKLNPKKLHLYPSCWQRRKERRFVHREDERLKKKNRKKSGLALNHHHLPKVRSVTYSVCYGNKLWLPTELNWQVCFYIIPLKRMFYWLRKHSGFLFSIGAHLILEKAMTIWVVQPYGVSCPMGCPTPWGFLSYGVSYPVGCPVLWGVLPNGVSYPMGFPTQWGFLPYGVSYPMGYSCPFIYLTNTEFWEETPQDHKVKS